MSNKNITPSYEDEPNLFVARDFERKIHAALKKTPVDVNAIIELFPWQCAHVCNSARIILLGSKQGLTQWRNAEFILQIMEKTCNTVSAAAGKMEQGEAREKLLTALNTAANKDGARIENWSERIFNYRQSTAQKRGQTVFKMPADDLQASQRTVDVPTPARPLAGKNGQFALNLLTSVKCD